MMGKNKLEKMSNGLLNPDKRENLEIRLNYMDSCLKKDFKHRTRRFRAKHLGLLKGLYHDYLQRLCLAIHRNSHDRWN